VDERGWHLSTDAVEMLDAAAQTRLDDLRRWLTKQMRTIRLPDLLIAVDNDLRFTEHFVPPAQRGGRDAEDEKIDVALLEQVSPIEWDNVILYGQYVLDRAQVRCAGCLKDIFAAIWAVPL
jgi:hypothetical protein